MFTYYFFTGDFMKVLFIVNPCSGRGKIKTEILDILKIFCCAGYEVTTHITTRQGDAVDVAAAAVKKGYEQIICCGGDGTLNEVITGICTDGSHIPVSYIPAGTTNDFARTMDIDADMKKAAKKIVKAEEKVNVDIGKFSSNRYFTYIASFGLFTSVAYKTQQNIKNTLGHMAYIFEGIASMTNIEHYNISFTADGREYSGEYIYGGITNSTSVAGIFKYDQSVVDLCDGLFEVLMIKKPKNPNEFMKIVSGITSGDLSDTSVFDFCKASRVELNMPSGVVWTLDGEQANGKKKIVIENIPGRITMVK